MEDAIRIDVIADFFASNLTSCPEEAVESLLLRAKKDDEGKEMEEKSLSASMITLTLKFYEMMAAKPSNLYLLYLQLGEYFYWNHQLDEAMDLLLKAEEQWKGREEEHSIEHRYCQFLEMVICKKRGEDQMAQLFHQTNSSYLNLSLDQVQKEKGDILFKMLSLLQEYSSLSGDLETTLSLESQLEGIHTNYVLEKNEILYRSSRLLISKGRWNEAYQKLCKAYPNEKRTGKKNEILSFLNQCALHFSKTDAFENLQNYSRTVREELLPGIYVFVSQKEKDKLFSDISRDLMHASLYSAQEFNEEDFRTISYDNLLLMKNLDMITRQKFRQKLMETGNEWEKRSYQEYCNKLDTLYYHGDKLNVFKKAILENSVANFMSYNFLVSVKDVIMEFPDTKKVISHLKDNQVLIEYAFTGSEEDRKIIAFVLTSNSNSPEIIEICPFSKIQAFLSRDKDSINKIYSDEEISDLLLKPLSAYLTCPNILIAPVAELSLINFHALLYQGKPFGQDYNINSIISGASLVTKSSGSTKSNARDAILYGGIKYDLDEETMITESEKWQDKERGLALNYLHYSDIEVDYIEKLLKDNGIKARSFKGEKASEESFNHLPDSIHKVIHLATHAYYLSPKESKQRRFFTTDIDFKTSNLLHCGIFLSGSKKAWNNQEIPLGVEDGILTAEEISRMDLSGTELVVLSACNSGLGDIDETEGLYGLQRAFFQAGVKYQLVTLWSVSDSVALEFMQHFYDALIKNRLSLQQAFDNAVMKIKASYPQPYNWAPFLLVKG